MSTFTELFFQKKLAELTTRQSSIQILSQWIILHRKNHAIIVNIWFQQLLKETSEHKKLVLMWLANDVIQNSINKYPEYTKTFAHFLPKAFGHIGLISRSEKLFRKVSRILDVWVERRVYHLEMINNCRDRLNRRHEERGATGAMYNQNAAGGEHSRSQNISVRNSPKPEEIIEALTISCNYPSGDVVVRQSIADLPSEVADVNHIDQLKDKGAARDYKKQVDEAAALVDDYNGKLWDELTHRKKLTTMLGDFETEQKALLAQAEKRLEEETAFMAKLKNIHQKVKEHRSKFSD